jgi:curved DNA binding protein
MSSEDEKSVEAPEGDEVKEEVTDLSNSDVCTKYQEASKIVNLALEGLVGQCVPGAKILDLCEFGQTILEASAVKLYTKKVNGKAIDRGVAFPVCISVNDIVCNHSPLATEERPDLKAGDIVKMDLGCHIDGYIAVAAHTVIVKESADAAAPPEDKELGNVAVAAYNAMLVAAASISAGAKNSEVTAAVQRVASAYGVTPISSVRMHQMKRYVLDGVKEVALKAPDPEEPEEEKVPECTFEQAEVYAVDVAMSTGDGRARPGELRTTVFKRNVEKQYLLKVKASRQVLAEVDKKFPTLPFTMRHLTDVRTARLGINECIAHGLLTPYPSLHEYSGKVAHFKCTVLLLPSGTTRVTGLKLPEYFTTDKQADEETLKILQEIADKEAKKAAQKAKKKNKKNK